MTTILLVWAIVLLVFVLFVLASHRFNTPHPEPNPTAEQVKGVVEVYEILGMYDGPIQ